MKPLEYSYDYFNNKLILDREPIGEVENNKLIKIQRLCKGAHVYVCNEYNCSCEAYDPHPYKPFGFSYDEVNNRLILNREPKDEMENNKLIDIQRLCNNAHVYVRDELGFSYEAYDPNVPFEYDEDYKI